MTSHLDSFQTTRRKRIPGPRCLRTFLAWHRSRRIVSWLWGVRLVQAECPAWCPKGWGPVIAGCLYPRRPGMDLPLTRPVGDLNPRPPASEPTLPPTELSGPLWSSSDSPDEMPSVVLQGLEATGCRVLIRLTYARPGPQTIYIYIYIYRERERAREIHIRMCVYIYIYIYMHTYIGIHIS